MPNIKISIRLPSEVVDQLEGRVQRGDFKNLSEALRDRLVPKDGVI